jgi:hypothetical protein
MIDADVLNSKSPRESYDPLKDLKALSSSSNLASDMSEYVNNPLGLETISQQTQLAKDQLAAEKMMSSAIGGISAEFDKIKSVEVKNTFKKIVGDSPKGGIIAKLISLILSFVTLPVRITMIAKGLGESATSIALGSEGLGKSFKLAGQDIWALLVTIGTIISKYFLCLLSFIIGTIIGCFFVHFITFFTSVVFLIFPLSVYVIKESTGFDIGPFVDEVLEKMDEVDDQMAVYTNVNLMKWPKSINLVCYTCFGKRVKLKDILADVMAIKTIGDIISYDFSVRMPGYMKRGRPFGIAAGKSFDKAAGPAGDLFRK